MFWKDVFNNNNSQPIIMGILNVTPDSFSDGGKFIQVEQAIDHANRMIEEGANIIDIGGESTRPGAKTISIQEEQDRIMPVVEALMKQNIPVSVDTKNTETMRTALDVGVTFINDVNALQAEGAVEIVAEHDAYVCLMHMQNNPETMQDAPQYTNVLQEITDFLSERIGVCVDSGVKKERICIDPGIGFGKALEHNTSIIKNIDHFSLLGCPILLGTSRKSFIEKISQDASASDQRLAGSLSSILWGLSAGVQMFRVHDVFETKQAFDVWQAISEAESF